MTKKELRYLVFAASALQVIAIWVMYAAADANPTLLRHMFAVEGGFFLVTWIALYQVASRVMYPKIEPVHLRLALLDSGGVLKSELDLSGRNSVVIGKNTADVTADIDLSDSEHPEYVDDQHAVFNCIGTQWYVEAVSETQSVGLKKSGESVIGKLKQDIPYPIGPGDLVYISYERIVVRG